MFGFVVVLFVQRTLVVVVVVVVVVVIITRTRSTRWGFRLFLAGLLDVLLGVLLIVLQPLGGVGRSDQRGGVFGFVVVVVDYADVMRFIILGVSVVFITRPRST